MFFFLLRAAIAEGVWIVVVELLGHLAFLGKVYGHHHYVLLVDQGKALPSEDRVFPEELELEGLVKWARLLVVKQVCLETGKLAYFENELVLLLACRVVVLEDQSNHSGIHKFLFVIDFLASNLEEHSSIGLGNKAILILFVPFELEFTDFSLFQGLELKFIEGKTACKVVHWKFSIGDFPEVKTVVIRNQRYHAWVHTGVGLNARPVNGEKRVRRWPGTFAIGWCGLELPDLHLEPFVSFFMHKLL